MSLTNKLMHTESPWNPKVMIGRLVTRLLPDTALHALKRRYYGYLVKREPENWAERDQVVVDHLIAPGDSVIDIGASIGEYTRYLSSKVGPQGHVYSFEPNPETFDF